jgi:uncharacterized protein (TIGR03089 family)
VVGGPAGRDTGAPGAPYAVPVALPRDVAGVLSILAAEAGRPRLTWYGTDGERVELSSAVLANWVAKTTNLLVEEFDAGPGVRVGLDLPPHWRTVVWALAAWRCGATVALGPAADDADVVVSDRPAERSGAGQLVAVALPALARRFDGPLPPSAVDAAGAVMTYGDVIGWAPEPDAGEPALDPGGPSHADLVAWASSGTTAPAASRALVTAGPDRDADVAALLRTVLGVLAGGGSVVVLAPSVAADLDADTARRERLVSSERVTA